MAHPQIAAFARMAKGGQNPNRLIAGQATKLSRTMHDIRYDAVNDEFFVTNPFAQAVMAFPGNANGNQPPLRVIQGPKTQMTASDRLEIDPVHNELYVPSGDSILVFPLRANGDVAPLRVLKGPDTQLVLATTVVVDPVHNLLVVGLNKPNRPNAPDGALLIFNRTDSGNAKPIRVIRGPKSGITRINQMALIPHRKLVVATQPGPIQVMEPEDAFIGVWSLDDNGDVPPRYIVHTDAKTNMKKPRGVVLDFKKKEMIVGDMRLNSVLTFYFPEIF